ncbi:MAG: hypothetical protein ACKVT1_20115 [Dehalococcoidia bacterium]
MGQPARGPAGVSADAYANAVDRLRINFRVAVYTTVMGVVLLLASAAAMILLLLAGEPVTAAVPAVVGVLDIAWAVSERPWRQLLLANNRIALSDSLWVSYLETKEAIRESGLDGKDQLAELLAAQSLWVSRIGAIAQDDYSLAFEALDEINQRGYRVQSRLRVEPKDVVAASLAFGGQTGGTLSELEERGGRPNGG